MHTHLWSLLNTGPYTQASVRMSRCKRAVLNTASDWTPSAAPEGNQVSQQCWIRTLNTPDRTWANSMISLTICQKPEAFSYVFWSQMAQVVFQAFPWPVVCRLWFWGSVPPWAAEAPGEKLSAQIPAAWTRSHEGLCSEPEPPSMMHIWPQCTEIHHTAPPGGENRPNN